MGILWRKFITNVGIEFETQAGDDKQSTEKSEGEPVLENVRGCEPNGVINHLRNVLAKLDIPEGGLRSFTGLPVMTHGFFPGGNGLYEGINAD